MSKKCIFSLLITTFAIIFTICESTYLKYYIEDYCLDSNTDPNVGLLNDSAINTSLIIESTRIGHRISNKTCAIRIFMSKKVDGMIVTVQNISINNTSGKKCADFIQFGSSPMGKWCETKDAQSLIFSNSSVDIVFNAQINSSSNFKIVITPYQNPVFGAYCTTWAPFRCEESLHYECISKNFECDAINNCPNGFDETKCSNLGNDTQQQEIIEVNNGSLIGVNKYSQVEYHEYSVLDNCKPKLVNVIKLKPGADNTIVPAILRLSPNDTKISNETCVIRFSIPSSPWYSAYGLILGIDYISIKSNKNKTCDDYLQVQESEKWCENKSDTIGKSFKEGKFLDILFHAGEDSESKFQLVITPFKDTVLRSCWGDFKCSGDDECIDQQFHCDQHNNCPHSQDQAGCTSPPPSPTTTSTTTTSKTTSTTPKAKTTASTTTSTTPHSTTTIHSTTPSGNITTTTSPKHGKLSGGSIALIVIGSTIGILLIIIIIYLIIRKRRLNTIGYSSINND
jgi:hypothetical protein